MEKTLKRSAFTWNIGKDTLIAIVSSFLMLPIYYINSQYGTQNPIIFFGVFVVLGHFVLNTIVPAYVVFKISGEGLKGLGITKDKLILSLSISIIVCVLSYYQFDELAQQKGINVIPHLLFNALVFWEVLFVYGWLQLRFEKAFGYVVAPILSAFCFCLYHLGSFNPSDLPSLFISGLVFGILFGLTRNILILYPIAWSVSSGIGTLMGGYIGTWSDVYIYLAVLLIQICIIFFIKNKG